jgi:glyoxylase-like metal-dependent hydrolase (beta-lactamase superfamily II)
MKARFGGAGKAKNGLIAGQVSCCQRAAGEASLARVQIHTFELPPLGTNAYLLAAPGRDDAVLIDAPPEAWAAIAPTLAKSQRKLATVLLTHGHWDHMADAAACQAAGVAVHAHAADREWVEHPMMQADFMIDGIEIAPARVDYFLTHGQILEVAGVSFEVRHVPGHAPGNVLFYSVAMKAAFVGDVIFAGSVGRADLPGGDWAILENSIRTQVYTLPGETVIYPGHGPATTVARERATNRFVRG